MRTVKQLMNEETQNKIEIFKEIFRTRLKELREEKKLSQKAIADKLKCPVSTYANWEQGRTEPSIFDIYNLLYVFEIEANELFNVNDIT